MRKLLFLIMFSLLVSGCTSVDKVLKNNVTQDNKKLSEEQIKEINRNSKGNPRPSETKKKNTVISSDKIGDNVELFDANIDTSNWRTLMMKGYDFKFNYPSDWYYDFEFYQNGNRIVFYDDQDNLKMKIKAPSMRDINFCTIKKISKAYFFNTNDLDTDLYLELPDNYSDYDSEVIVYWEKMKNKEDWINHFCFDRFQENGEIYYVNNFENKKEGLSVLYGIVESFLFLSDKEIEELEEMDIFYEINERVKNDIMENTSKYLKNMDYMKIIDIGAVSNGRPMSVFSKNKDSNIKITFSGNVIIDGEFDYGNEMYFCDNVNFIVSATSSLKMIPDFVNLERGARLCLGGDYSQEAFGLEGSSGKAVIEIDRYTLSSYPSEIINYANLVKVLRIY